MSTPWQITRAIEHRKGLIMENILKFLTIIGAFRVKDNKPYYLRILHPIGLIWLIFIILISPFYCMFSNESMQDFYKQVYRDTGLW